MQRRVVLGVLALVVLVLSCGAPTGQEDERRIDTVDVDDPIDIYLQTQFDQKGPRPVEGLSGMLPSDFPEDFPIVTPSSLVDFGDRAGGGRFILLVTSAAARDAQLERLHEAGWSLSGGPDRWRAHRGGRGVEVELRQQAGVLEIRVDY